MFKGLTEDIKGQGLDYIIESLGVTHLYNYYQFMIFEGDELNPKESYNWGYNPKSI